MSSAQDIFRLLFYLWECGVSEGMYHLQNERYCGKHQSRDKEIDHALHVVECYINERVGETVTEVSSDEYFRTTCKTRTNDKKKCEYCKDRFLCWTE